MKTLKTIILFLAASFSLSQTMAQTADDIVNKYINAVGGKDILNSIKTIYIESSFDIMGSEAPSTTYIVNGKGYKSVLNFNGTEIVQCITDKGGWTINPMMGQTTAVALPQDQVKASQSQLEAGGPLFNYVAKGNKVELIGKDTSGGKNQYKVQLTTKDATATMTFYIDAITFFINKVISKASVSGQDLETTITFNDYKKTDFGYVMAYSQQINLPQITLNVTHKKIEVNKTIDPAIFDMPK